MFTGELILLQGIRRLSVYQHFQEETDLYESDILQETDLYMPDSFFSESYLCIVLLYLYYVIAFTNELCLNQHFQAFSPLKQQSRMKPNFI